MFPFSRSAKYFAKLACSLNPVFYEINKKSIMRSISIIYKHNTQGYGGLFQFDDLATKLQVFVLHSFPIPTSRKNGDIRQIFRTCS